VENFLTKGVIITFLGKTLVHGVNKLVITFHAGN